MPEEALRVRRIMGRYIGSSSANELIVDLETEGIRTKIQKRTSGPHRGGIPFRRGSLFHLLKNPIYRGMIVHKGKSYPGEHDAIVDEDLWQAVQVRLAAKAPSRKRPTNDEQDAILKGLLTDPHGRPMVPTFTCKGTRRYRYYETRRDLAVSGQPEATRYPLRQLDRHMVDHLVEFLADEHRLRQVSGLQDGKSLKVLFEKALVLLERLSRGREWPDVLCDLVSSIVIAQDKITIAISPSALAIADLKLEIVLPRKKPFREAKLRIGGKANVAIQSNQTLIGLVRDAAEARKLVMRSPNMSLNQIANREKRCRKQLARLLKVSWLSPRITQAILEGRQPASLSRKWLYEIDLPFDWSEQERLIQINH